MAEQPASCAPALTLLHTSDAHLPVFAALAARLHPGRALRQEVRADWLARAQSGSDTMLAPEIAAAIRAAPGPVICTCTSIGPLAEAAGAIRIDRPMMAEAARHPSPILLVWCLEATREATAHLLAAEMVGAGSRAAVLPLALPALWPLFVAGQTAAFHTAIADAVRAALAVHPAGVVVLAQASMAGAAALLAETGVPVLTSPELALRAV